MVETAFVVGCALAVIASGYLKLLRPDPARAAIDAAAIPVLSEWTHAARLVGAAELAVGFAVVATGHVVATTALSILYVGFVVFVLRLRERSPSTGCGCIGGASEPPGLAHILVSANAAIVCSPMVATTADPLADLDTGRILGSLAIATVVALAILLIPAAVRPRRV